LSGLATAIPSQTRVAPSSRSARFAMVSAQLALLLIVFRSYRIEEPAFFVLAVVMFAGFPLSYWAPDVWKERVFVGLSIAGAFFIAEPRVAGGILAFAIVIYGVVRLPASYRVRAVTIIALFAAATLLRGRGFTGISPQFWATLGAIFMFRLFVFLYDLRSMKSPPPFSHFASYFLMLPNYYFLFFPVVDYQTMRKSLGRREHGEVAQSGVLWIVRGTVHLMLYRAVVAALPEGPYGVTSLRLLVENMVLTYLLYLRVSGTFHIIVGMMHLYGYDLPETHRRYLLASSLNDFWRRINIYWKDFMVKMVYFPMFFRLRRSGAVRAQVVATGLVFVATWALHAYQYYWLSGRLLLSTTDAAFWLILGTLVIFNLLIELRARSAGRTPSNDRLVVATKTLMTLALIVVLWSMWNSPTFSAWFELLTYWEIG